MSLDFLFSLEILDVAYGLLLLHLDLSAFSHFVHISGHFLFWFYLEKIQGHTPWVVLLNFMQHIIQLSLQFLDVPPVSNHDHLP